MSHGASDGANAEPNLTPLLDVVLQLLMFFMMCVNFVTEQVNEDIKLPSSQQAKPMDKGETDVLFLNLKPFHSDEFKDRLDAQELARAQQRFPVDGDPCVIVPGNREPMRMVDVKYWLEQKYQDALKTTKQVNTAIIIRADKDSNYDHVYRLMQMCKSQGYRQLKLRALTQSGGAS